MLQTPNFMEHATPIQTGRYVSGSNLYNNGWLSSYRLFVLVSVRTDESTQNTGRDYVSYKLCPM